MRVNQLKKTLKSGEVALGTLVWGTPGVGSCIHLRKPGWTM